jgi:putative peptidoglycan lipid II flippase
MATNLVLTLVLGLVLPFGHVGVAAATSAAGWVNALTLMIVLHRRGQFRLDERSKRVIPRILAAALGMGVVLWGLDRACAPFFAGPFVTRTLALALVIGFGAAVFALLAVLLGATQWREVRERLALTGRPRGGDKSP